ncbi:MAG: hypothetical protein V4666_07705 [Bacteroidota bacterium]
MKFFLRSTLYLSVFALAGVIFQISCSNSDNLNQNLNVTQVNKLIYFKNTGTASGLQLWTSNYDGTSQTQIPISLPTNVYINNANQGATPRLSPDGQKVFFVTLNITTSNYSIYSCDINGSNLQEIITSTNPEYLVIGSAN